MRKTPKGFIYFIFLAMLFITQESHAVFNPYTYLNYLEDIESANNSAKTLVQEITLVKNRMQSLNYQIKNTGRFNHTQWRSLLSFIEQLDRLTRQGQALSYSASNVDSEFKQRYPNFDNSPYGQTNYTKAYETWNATTLDTLRSTLDAAGFSAQDFQKEESFLNQLKSQGQSATGRMQVLQVSTELSADNVNQLEELKRIVVAQTNAQNAYMAYKVSKDSYNEKSLQEINRHIKTQFPKYKNNAHFGELGRQ